MNHFLARPAIVWLFRLLFLSAAVFAIFFALETVIRDPLGGLWDKYKHAISFGTLAVLAAFAFPRMPLLRIGERLSFLGALVEVFQAIPMLHRDCDWKDWVADTLAITLALAMVAASGLRRSGQQI